MENLLLEKLAAAIFLTASTALGVWAPFCCLHGGIDGAPQRLRLLFRVMARPLSMANCFSVGMLLAMALIHALPCALEDSHAVSTKTLCGATLCGILLPALLDRSINAHGTQNGQAHRHDLWHSHESPHTSSPVSFVMLLMYFHATAEGVMLGLEESTAALLNSAVPLLIHRFFDGVVVGISISKELSFISEAGGEAMPLSAENGVNSSGSSLCTLLRWYLWRRSVLLWLSIMPASVLVCGILRSDGSVNGVHGADQRHEGGHHGMGSRKVGEEALPVWMAVAEAMNAGFFLFTGLMILLHEDLRGVWASVSLLLGVLLVCFIDAMIN